MSKEYLQSGRVKQKIETRDQILTSAKYFLSKGEVFSLDDVAKRAKISRATIYRYYSNTEILASEAGLDINTKTPESIYNELKEQELEAVVLGIQDYFNTLALDHEKAFRKYLSIALNVKSSKIRRGARRTKTLKLALEDTNFSGRDQKDLANLLTMWMGIEPIIVAKDVCGLDDEEAKKLLNKGVQLILKGWLHSD